MTETRKARRRRLLARLGAETQPKVLPPDIIFLPDQSLPQESAVTAQPVIAAQPATGIASPAAQEETLVTGRKGRHLGARRLENGRTERLDHRVTAEEKAALKARAEAAGMTVTEFVCWKTLGGTEPNSGGDKPRPALSEAEIEFRRKLLAEMGKRGSNLNQIAHHLNGCDFREVADEMLALRADIDAALEEHHGVCDEIMVALGIRRRAA
jgi:Bacterial mobilisation protein (MobC)